ncbi:MAG: flagellar hook-length control protein FliK [Phenylobacterium sp.]|uniref:flagellar hook-length control protein FliK n=1 Tax=Phenylobacterium sp. TaxID=1871053 RepID=UPI0027229122|nr:flagellar hook-length control protein FliK [Phenylobacterium sp.]MDO8912527.1 flagellar hook-length control protein FliK [Phenylobacterium sp.]
MTAPLLNASTLTPTGAAGGAAGLFGAAAGGGPAAGFEALMAAFFGGPGAAEPMLGADGKPVVQATGPAKGDKATADGKAEGEVADTATPSTDALILAALLAQPIAAPPPIVPTTAEGQAEGETPAGGSAAPAFGPVVSDAALAQALQPAKAADAKAANTAGVVAQAAADTATAQASEAQTDAEPAHLAGADASSVLDEGKPAAARQPTAAAPPPPPEAAAPRPVTPPPAAIAAAAVAATNPAPPPAPVADTADAPAAVEAVVAADAVETAEADAAPAPPVAAPKTKTAARAARNETGARAEPTTAPTVAVADADPLGPVVAPTQTAETFDSGSQGKRENAAPTVEAKADTDTGQPVAPNVGEAAATASTSAPVEARAGPQTVAHLAAQIVKKLEGRSTQFDVALNPEGMGRVDVRIEIGAQGRLTASMSFENPQAAAELRTRANELQKALEQAGFDVSGGLRFDVAADRGHGQAGQGQFGQDAQNNGGAWRGKAFQAALDSADPSADVALSGGLNLQRRTLMSGVDVRI